VSRFVICSQGGSAGKVGDKTLLIERFLETSRQAQAAESRAKADPTQIAFLALSLATGMQLIRHFVLDAAEHGKRTQFSDQMPSEAFAADALDLLFS